MKYIVAIVMWIESFSFERMRIGKKVHAHWMELNK